MSARYCTSNSDRVREERLRNLRRNLYKIRKCGQQDGQKRWQNQTEDGQFHPQ